MRLSFWRIKTTANATIPVNDLETKFENLHLTRIYSNRYARIRIACDIRIVYGPKHKVVYVFIQQQCQKKRQ